MVFRLLLKHHLAVADVECELFMTLDEVQKHMNVQNQKRKQHLGMMKYMLRNILIKPKHIEVQILGDTHGNIVHLI